MAPTRYTYRAQEVNSEGHWVCGSYMKFLPYTPSPLSGDPAESEYRHIIITEDFSDFNMSRGLRIYEVKPETVCQCTQTRDVTGKPVYENDIVEYQELMFIVVWDGIGFSLKYPTNGALVDFPRGNNVVKILGSTIENPGILN